MGTLATKEEAYERRDEMREEMQEVREEVHATKDGFSIAFDKLRGDVFGSLKDLRGNDVQVADHERRITNLEMAKAA